MRAKNSLFFQIISILVVIFCMLYAAPRSSAACFSSSNVSGNVSISASCGITNTEVVDTCSLSEADSANESTVTITGGSPTIVAVSTGDQWVVGTISLGSNGSVTVGGGGEILVGSNQVYTTLDNDTDGWAADYALNSSSPSGYRRICLMRHRSTVDCSDSAYSTTNTCYSYSQGYYYGYSQGYYYGYSQGYYYTYSQSMYYSYGQSSYYHIFWPGFSPN